MILKQYAFANGSEAVTFSGINMQRLANTANINNISPYDYAAFEPSQIAKSRRLFNADADELSYSSAVLGDNNGEYSNVKITATFAIATALSRINFDCRPMLEKITIVATLSDDTTKTFNYLEIENNYISFDSSLQVKSLEVQVLKVNEPNRFFNLFGMSFGAVVIINEDYIKNYKLIDEISVSGRELPTGKLELTLTELPDDFLPDYHQKLEILDDDGVLKYTFYIEEFSETNNDGYVITYYDCVGLLEDEFPGGFYDDVYDKFTPTETEIWPLGSDEVILSNVKEIVDEILEGTKIPYYFENQEIENTEVKGIIPATTKRNALIYIANATGYKWQKQPYLKLINPIDDVIEIFDESTTFDDLRIDTKTPAKQVILKRFVQIWEQTDTNTPTLVSQTVKEVEADIDYAFLYNKLYPPCLVGSTQSLGGHSGEILNYKKLYDKKIVYNFKYTGTATISACITEKYKQLEISSLEKHIDNYELFPSYTTETIDSFTLINQNNVDNILTKLLDYYSSKDSITARVIWSNPQIGVKVKFMIGGKEYTKTVKKITTSDLDDEVVEIEVE